MGSIRRALFVFLCRSVRLLLGLRYKIRVEGLEKIAPLQNSQHGILFLPNHPAEIDPVILTSILGPGFAPRSVMVQHFYEMKGFRGILDFCRVVPVPSMEDLPGVWKKKELAKALADIEKDLASGENYLIYPAGKLKQTGAEKIGGSSFVHTLCLRRKNTPLVLVRTEGLWGSSFSAYRTGAPPDFGKMLGCGLKALLKGGLFFVPKRDVLVTFEPFPKGAVASERLSFNRSLEVWYNRYRNGDSEERLSLVPYSRFSKPEEVSFEERGPSSVETDPIVPEAVESEVLAYLSGLSKKPKDTLRRDSHLAFDLGLDSLDTAELHAFLDKRFDAGGALPGSLQTVSDVLRAIVCKDSITDREAKDPRRAPFRFRRCNRKPPLIPEASGIGEAFLKSCDRLGSKVACADVSSGPLSYRRLKRSALILGGVFRDLPCEHVGVLLPSSSWTYLSVIALILAGKIPVMLNWTAGKAALNHAKKTGAFSATLTSKKFLNKIYLEDLGDVEDTFVFLEEIKPRISLQAKLRGLLFSFLPSNLLLRRLNLSRDPAKTAVILFTSGTGSMPKAVPLSHGNILSNQRSVLSVSGLKGSDSLYGVLPPFHSFGFSLTGLFPLLAGIPAFYSQDPTDGRKTAEEIEQTGVTAVCLAPSFLRSLFSAGNPRQLASLTLIVSGAEKPSPDLPLFVKNNLPGAEWIEGYGITECSPVVSLQRRGEHHEGVGRLIPGMEAALIDPSSLEPVSGEGELCFRGPSVFAGYLGESSDPFIEIEGKRWYRSGDLGRVGSNQIIYLTDRLKRVVKIGGEMISLSALERQLLDAGKEKMWYDPSRSAPPLAIVAGKSDKPELFLCTTFPVSEETVNLTLRERGGARLWKIAGVFPLAEIPLTGTGKVNYRVLEQTIESIHDKENRSGSV